MRFLPFVFCFLFLFGCTAQLTLVMQDAATPTVEKAPVVFSAELRTLESPSNQSGQLYFVEERPHPNYRIAELDMQNGAIRTIFSAPSRSLIHEIAADPAHQQLIISYMPPAEEGASLYDRSGLYTLALDGSEQLQRLIGADEPGVFYHQPTITTDGSTLVYVKYDPAADQPITVERYEFATGEHRVIAEHVVEPALAHDGSVLALTALNPDTQVQSIVVSDIDGQNLRTLIQEDQFYDVEQPRFSADNLWVYFVVLEKPVVSQTIEWIAFLTGARTAEAHGSHNLPGDWWRVSVDGGIPEQITGTSEMIVSAETAADNTSLAYATRTGLYLYASGDSRQLIKSRAIFNITWMR